MLNGETNMEDTNILVSKDYNKIKDVIFTDPSLMADDAKEQVKHLYFSIRDTEKQLHEAREKVRELESLLQDRKKDWSRISTLFTLEFETKEKEYKVQKSSIAITGLGNEIIGRNSMI